MKKTYQIAKNARGNEYIECFVCGRKSFHPKDVEYKYCAHCHQFHNLRTDFPIEGEQANRIIDDGLADVGQD